MKTGCAVLVVYVVVVVFVVLVVEVVDVVAVVVLRVKEKIRVMSMERQHKSACRPAGRPVVIVPVCSLVVLVWSFPPFDNDENSDVITHDSNDDKSSTYYQQVYPFLFAATVRLVLPRPICCRP